MAHTANDTDTINRTLWGFTALVALTGIAVVFSAPWSLQTLLPPAAAAAFEFDRAFLPIGGAVVGALYVLNAMLFALVYRDGQWRASTRLFDFGLTAVWSAALLWLILEPRIFLNATADKETKNWLGLVLLFLIVSLVSKYRRAARRS